MLPRMFMLIIQSTGTSHPITVKGLIDVIERCFRICETNAYSINTHFHVDFYLNVLNHILQFHFSCSVKAGGMRIVQHKTPNTERPAKDLEDCTGLTVSVHSTDIQK